MATRQYYDENSECMVSSTTGAVSITQQQQQQQPQSYSVVEVNSLAGAVFNFAGPSAMSNNTSQLDNDVDQQQQQQQHQSSNNDGQILNLFRLPSGGKPRVVLGESNLFMNNNNNILNSQGGTAAIAIPKKLCNRGRWLKEEDDRIRQLVAAYGENWAKVAHFFADRNEVQVSQRWNKVLNPKLVKGPWTKEVSLMKCLTTFHNSTHVFTPPTRRTRRLSNW